MTLEGRKEGVQIKEKRTRTNVFNQQAKQGTKKKQQTKKNRENFPRLTAEQRKLKKRQKLMKQLIEYFLVGTLLFFVLAFLFTMKTHIVNGESMNPTFDTKDYLIIKKTKNIARYDIITFDPIDPANTSYVKRIIGMPGDKLMLKQNQLYLSQSSFEKAKEDEFSDSTLILSLTDELAIERLRNLETIPNDHYFVVGDNRGNSKDSRAFGLIDKKQIEGKVLMRYFPFTKAGIVH